MSWRYWIALTALLSTPSFAQEEVKENEQDNDIELVKQCILNEVIGGDGKQTLDELRQKCSALEENKQLTALDKRKAREEVSKKNRNVITPHKRNYILPLSYVSHPNDRPYDGFDELTDEENGEPLDNLEAKYQLSIKVPLYDDFADDDQAIFFGFTLQSYWQIYNSEISSPFRETNYEPEIFWVNYLDEEHVLWGDEMAIALGISHQSNGRSQPNSRSWNRIYADFIWENRGFVFSFKPWYRIAEDKKEDPLEADGDDNPDIYKYMGYFEFSGAYRYQDHEFSFMTRNNLNSDNRGAIQLDWSFPMWGRLRGYAQYFNGYGESLIDYNADIERIGVGILLTDLL
ncbi:phospholipase A [Pseudoalteromonas carrageenovora]|uniref:Phospholipase A1 n=1 Tax=Pseudoalteromonas carrageenovora IAM 12662 TaxID=1314868 RepID=A0A2K4XDA3_PSEVC|nr:phospholipase A [Pseudoalteromonas carrageenovora]MBE0381160.1 phospholipase A1 [Pseudoalteromonas carrageenovora IAM 12662]MDO6465059.1 phospholipase A [Pseudoalteromonas carrageenovora]QBJ73168.1 phospholipase A1 [Pseudoalteromonas carrageenovora]SOU42291.1 Phospholipase [Pseudoalteromonas carrageenovora IAM 12662]GEB70970.1 phospholipase [Pseudoalteromonas carrageenovora]